MVKRLTTKHKSNMPRVQHLVPEDSMGVVLAPVLSLGYESHETWRKISL